MENLEKQPFNGNDQGEEDFLSLAEIWALIWNHKKWYAVSVVICVFFAAFYIYRTSPTFSRTAKVIIDDSNENSTLRDLASFTGGMSRYRTSGMSNVYNEIEAFSSPDIMSTVIQKLGLETSYREKQFLRSRELFQNSPVTVLQAGDNHVSAYSFELTKSGDSTFVLKKFRVAGKDVEELDETVEGRLRDTLDTPVGKLVVLPSMVYADWKKPKPIYVSWVSPRRLAKAYTKSLSVSLSGKESTVLVLTFKDRFPARAESVLRTLIDVYNTQWVENKNKSARNTTSFINDRLVIIEKELGGVEESLKDYKASHKITDIQSLSASYMEASSQFKARSFEVSNQLAIAKFIKEYLDNPAHDGALLPANSGIESTTIEAQIREYNQIVLNRDRLINDSSNENPLVADLNQSIASLKVAINRSVDNLISTLELQAQKVDAEENAIMSKISNTSGQELQLLSIERQQKIKEELYVFLLKKREENEIASLVNVGNTRLVMAPDGSDFPESPNKKMIALVALFLGLGIPFGIFFMLKQLDNKVKTHSDIASVKVPFLAEVPEMEGDTSWKGKLRKKKTDSHDKRIVVEASNRNVINEAFRVMRTNLDFMTSQSHGCKKIMVTSFNPNAGKTFVIMNIAATMALRGAKVLIVDLDLRKGTLGIALNMNKTGVSAYLNGKISDPVPSIQNLRENLDVLTVGSLPPNPAELLDSERFRGMMDILAEHYDYVFMDCPPIDIVADSSIIAKSADYTIFVMRAGLFDKRGLPLLNELYASKVYSNMSLVLNGVDLSARKYGNYSRYGYGYGYGNTDSGSVNS